MKNLHERMPKRIQRKRVKGWRMPENTVYVGRGSRYGNPYRVGIDGNRYEVLYLYVQWLSEIMEENPDFLKLLKGKDLACWCPLDKPCHADILLDLANE
jgi:hypothetical protein